MLASHGSILYNDSHEAKSKDATQRKFLSLGHLELPKEKDRQQGNDEVLHRANGSDSHKDGSLIVASHLVLESPGDVEQVEKALRWIAGKRDDEDKSDAVQDAKNDGCPNPIHKGDREGASNSSVKAEDRDLD